MENFHTTTLAGALEALTKVGTSHEEVLATLLASIATSLAAIADAVADPEDQEEKDEN